MSIKIYNPAEEKFGKLSNLYDFSMKIDDKNWRNVSQYIYTEMIPSIVYKKNMMNSDNFNIYNNYLKYSKQSEIDLLSISLLDILKVKFENPKMMEVLLSTGNSPIIYKSNNNILGSGPDDKGLNLIGNYMVQIRNQYIKSNIKKEEYEKRIDDIYNTYLVMKIFEDLIFSENIEDIENKYKNMSMVEIINNYGKEKIISKVVSKKVIMQMYTGDYSNSILDDYERDPIRNLYHIISESDKFSSDITFRNLINRMMNIYNSTTYNVIFEYVKKDKIKKVAEYKKNKIRDDIFNLYIDNIISRKFPLLNEKEHQIAKNQMLSIMSNDDINMLKDKIYKIKNKPNPIEKEINDIIENIKIPSESEIEKAENFDIFNNISTTLKNKNDVYSPPKSPKLTPEYLKEFGNSDKIGKGIGILKVPVSKKNEEEFMKDIMEDNKSVSSSSSTFDLSSESEDEDYDDMINIVDFEEILIDHLNKKLFEFTNNINNDYRSYIKYFLNLTTKLDDKTKEKIYNSIIKKGNDGIFYDYFKTIYDKNSNKNSNKNIDYGNGNIKPVIIYPGVPSTNYSISYSNIKYSLESLSPVYYTGHLKIENLEFPTVSHYLVTKLYLLLPDIKNIKEVYKYIRTRTISRYDPSKSDVEFVTIDQANEVYNFISYRKKYKKITELAKTGLDKKFEKSELLIDTLLSTESKSIIWDDFNDNILGIASGKSYNINYKYEDEDTLDILSYITKSTYYTKGENFVGKYLVILRNTTRDSIDKDKKTYIINNNFVDFYNNKIFNSWVNSKVNDICKTILKFKKYFNIKYNTGLEINYNLIEIINSKIYNLCSSKDEFKKISTENIPEDFINNIKKYLRKINPNISQFFWKCILSNISYLILHLKDPSFYNIQKIIYRTENILSKNDKCNMFSTNNKINCIILAIINLLVNISKIDKEKIIFSNDESIRYLDYKVDENDIQLVISIILNISMDTLKDKKSIIKDIVYKEIDKEEIDIEKPINNIYESNFEILGIDVDSEKELSGKDYDEESENDFEDYPSDQSKTDDEYFNDDNYNDDGNGDTDNEEEKRIITFDEKKVSELETKNNIIKYLKENKIFYKNPIKVSKYIYQATIFILNYKMDNKIKNNRINFFNNFK